MDKSRPEKRGGPRFWLALWAAKLSVPVLKLTRHNGTNFPGSLAMKLCPHFLRYLARPGRVVAVTGTNGKTTVTNLIRDVLEDAGYRVLSNRAGSNMYAGVATAMLEGVSAFNRCRRDVAVLEVDERSTRFVFPDLTPELLAVTNLFRDSITRNAHPQFIRDILTRATPRETKLVLNADDLISSGVAPENPRVYFGIERMDTDKAERKSRLNDMRICPRCSGALSYDYQRYHHIGRARCLDCGFESPAYDYAGCQVDMSNMTIRVRENGGEETYKLFSDALFNIYNTVTAVAMLREFGMDRQEVKRRLDKTNIVGTRHTEEVISGVTLVNQLSKSLNASACSRNFEYIAAQPGEKEALLLLDTLDTAHGYSENICWMYDCDFEHLNDPHLHLVVTGPRGLDTMFRLKMAGVDPERIDYARDAMDAADKLRLEPGTTVYILFGGDDSKLLDRAVKEKIEAKLREREAGRS